MDHSAFGARRVDMAFEPWSILPVIISPGSAPE